MKSSRKSITAMILCILILFTALFPVQAFADTASKLEIKVVPGRGTLVINGQNIAAEKPVMYDGILYVPMRTVLEAMGAEVNWNGDGRISVIFRDVDLELTVGQNICTVNQVEKPAAAAPRYAGNTVMIPVSTLNEFLGTKTVYDSKTRVTNIILEDDGALSDLSFLTGGIVKPVLGNSYFGWSINVPKGSRIGNTSFNSNYVLVENDQRGITLEISVEAGEETDVKSYYEKALENPAEYFDGEIYDSTLNTSQVPAYADFLYNSAYDEAVFRRVFVKGGHVYKLTLASYMDNNPEKLGSNSYYKSIIDSFNLSFPASSKDVQDLSRVKFGLATYENYINSESGKKYLSWELSVLPEWGLQNPDFMNPYYTEIGVGKKEYISIEISRMKDSDGAEQFGKRVEEFDRRNYNSQYYTFKEGKVSELAGFKSYHMIYSVKLGEAGYVYDETFILQGGLIYDITLKCPENRYEAQKENYAKVLETLKLNVKDNPKLLEEMEKYEYNRDRSRVGKDDNLTLFENKKYRWSMKLPGYWNKAGYPESEVQSFANMSNGAMAVVEVVENTPENKGMSDEDRFMFIKDTVDSEEVKLISEENLNEKGGTVRKYNLRAENPKEERYYNISIYVVDKTAYSYAFATAIPDLYTSEANLEELEALWQSFAPEIQVKEESTAGTEQKE